MNTKNKRNSVILATIVSAVLLCSLLIVSSLSSLSNTGPNVNKFGDVGMWSSVGTVLIFYLIPLIIYALGVDSMRIVMAIFCGLGMLIAITALLVMVFMDIFSYNSMIISIGAISLGVAAFLSNIIWYFVAFRASNKVYES
ncbi:MULTISPECIES: DUF5391 family protein [Priestia]|uniref:DUF5391 family protein n=1 Tax=Priestia TaxID=2800373 RepID=UPI000C036618|nr:MULTISPECIES: DUF5391 family protein [Priestia]MCM3796898.1 DUF5391 domain-containing protein [Priestia megaterium]PGK30305.1 hypothetical protein CN902_12585 [Priestia megaterium]